MLTNSIVSPFQDVAQRYIDEQRVEEIFFSKGTYQVHLKDLKTDDPAWAFLQLTDNKNAKDFFCSCQTESATLCEHLAAAILVIFLDHPEPLHKRFEHSFWCKITQHFAQKYGFNHSLLNRNQNKYSLKIDHKTVFTLTSKTPHIRNYFTEIIDERKKETEETSLKFSNLPKKELALWKEGRPSFDLRYELSFWSDLAKFLMISQEMKHPYKIQFTYKDNFPEVLKVEFDHFECSFHLTKELLTPLIPHLSTIKSPLKVEHSLSEDIEKIDYCPKKKILSIHPKKQQSTQKKDQKGIQLGEWIYLPKKGFYHSGPEPIDEVRSILSHSIDEQLEKNTDFFQKHLKNTVLQSKPKSTQYLIQFDGDWNLKIHLYLFDPEDFSHKHSTFFGHWVFIEDKGFFRLSENIFQQPSLFIPKDKVTEFIRQYRYWLNSQKGFEVHLAPLETQTSYQLNSHKQLIFSSKLSYKNEVHHDFGDWIYIQNQGFYSKPRHSSPIRGGVVVEAENISKFIHLNQEDLEAVPQFFSNHCPFKEVSLQLHANLETQSILIEPKYTYHPEYENKPVLFFDLYSYVENEGFYKLPKEMQLPKGFRKKVSIHPKDQTAFFAFQLQSLKPHISHIDPRLSEFDSLDLQLESHQDQVYKLNYESEKGKASVIEMIEAIKADQPYLISEAGLIPLTHPRFAWLKELSDKQIEPEGLKLTSLDIIRIEALNSLYSDVQSPILSKIKAGEDMTLPSLRGFKTKLRPYQTIGLNWLWKLYRYHLSGILCDDMGLGKTLQAMALIAAIKAQKAKRPEPGYKVPKKKFLIVCPTSVIYHWQDKLAQFYPKLKILTFYGLSRSLKRFQQTFDVLLTSYGILRIDQKAFEKYHFDLVIYDEVQIAKNHRSLTYAALKKIKAHMKLGLTGTPIENNLRELKALFDLIVPTYLPTEERFKSLFINPIERDHDANQSALLKKLISPFILRRKKEEVVLDLPDKTEEVAKCELSSDQVKLYQETLDASKEKLLKDLGDQTKEVPYIHVFALLNKLKQVCNHPMSIDPILYKGMESGKWDLFLQLLEEARESHQKVVVFSQYLNMLDLIEEYCKEHRIGYATIRGSTKDRRTPLKRFQNDPECEIFIGSLKAVGLGIDLTAASVVIHYDRWWNAAREQQATDRVHRIGQQKGVMVFKLVTLNTLEEKIDRMIAKKEKLMEEVIGTSDEEQIKGFSRQDLIDLLQFAHKDIYTSS